MTASSVLSSRIRLRSARSSADSLVSGQRSHAAVPVAAAGAHESNFGPIPYHRRWRWGSPHPRCLPLTVPEARHARKERAVPIDVSSRL